MLKSLRIFKGLSLPWIRTKDLLFLLFLRRHHIPIGYFFRDMYWLFPEVYGSQKNNLKVFLMSLFGRFEIFFASKIANKIFCPSTAFSQYLSAEFAVNATPLPPGSDLVPNNREAHPAEEDKASKKIRLLFVGGTGELYNPKLFLSALKKCASEQLLLRICTRKAEWDEYMKGFELPKNLEVVHLGPEALPRLYAQTDICVNYSPPSRYQRLCWGLKMSEYLRSGAPILMFKGVGVSELIAEKQYGWVIDYNETAVLNWMKSLVGAPLQIQQRAANVKRDQALYSWAHTADSLTHMMLEFCMR
jgi:glycosyltransferase involved in cell wall biosynthesis